jgi:hypothetical protein
VTQFINAVPLPLILTIDDYTVGAFSRIAFLFVCHSTRSEADPFKARGVVSNDLEIMLEGTFVESVGGCLVDMAKLASITSHELRKGDCEVDRNPPHQ